MRKPRSPRRQSGHRPAVSVTPVETLEKRVLLSRATGVDVSQYQNTINWSQVESSVNFAYIRASYGSASADPDFVTNANATKNSTIPIGFYHYAYYDIANHTPALEAANFWNQVSSYYNANGKYLMPMLDLEEGSALASGTGESNLSQWAEAWCADIAADGAAIGLHLVPIIYCSSSPAGSYFDTTPPQTIPLWVADYTGTTTPQTSTPTAGTGKWQTWQMWQYSSTGSVSGITGNVDVDVLNGDTTTLKDYIVSSTSGTPNGKWSANAAVQASPVAPATSVKAYSTIADARSLTSNYTNVASGTIGTIISGPTYAGSYQYWKVTFKNGVTGYVAEDFMITAPSAPTAVTLSSPANNAHLSAQPTFTWTSSPLATSYGVYINSVLKTTTTATSYTPGNVADGNDTWMVQAINSTGTANSATDSFELDTTPPTATLPTQSPTGGSSTFQFTVTYADATSGVNASTIGAGDVTVTGPNSFSQAASFVTYNSTTGVATYQITAPGGTWNAADNGTYTVLQVASSVADNFGNARAAGRIGLFSVNVFAYLSGAVLVVDFGNTTGSLSLSSSGQNLVVQQGSNSLNFRSGLLTGVTVTGTATGNTFTFTGPVTVPIELDLGGSASTVNVTAGTMTVSNDVTSTSPGLTLNVASGAAVAFTTNEALAALAINGGAVSLNSAASTTLNISGTFSITGAGTLDVGDGELLTMDPESVIQGYLQNGYNGGFWNGPGGIDSSVAFNDQTGATSVGYGDSADFAGTPSPFASTGSTPLASNQVVVKTAMVGDLLLSGNVGSEELSLLLSSYGTTTYDGTHLNTWAYGNIDYSTDGLVGPNDLSLFLSNYAINQSSGNNAAPAASANAAPASLPAASATDTTAPADTAAPMIVTATVAPKQPAIAHHHKRSSVLA